MNDGYEDRGLMFKRDLKRGKTLEISKKNLDASAASTCVSAGQTVGAGRADGLVPVESREGTRTRARTHRCLLRHPLCPSGRTPSKQTCLRVPEAPGSVRPRTPESKKEAGGRKPLSRMEAFAELRFCGEP